MSRRLALRGASVGSLAAAAAGIVALLAAPDAPGPLATTLLLSAALVLGGAAGYLAFAATARAVDDVTAAARRMESGRLGANVPGTSGAAGQLASAFNAMSHHVEDLLGTVEADQARLEAVFDASTDAMVAVSRDTKIRLLNQAAARTFGTSRDHALGRPFIEIARDYELDALIRRAAMGGNGEAMVLTFGGSRIPLRAAAVTIPGGGDWSVLLMLTDLTEVQRVESMRRDFVGNVSHELRTPLAAIRALVETMEAGAVDPGEETDEFLGRIHQQVDRLTALVNELLDLSRIESGAVELHPEEIDLAALVMEVTSLLQPRLEARGVTVHADPPPGIQVEADAPSIQRAVSNLLDNACKFSPDGGSIDVTVHDEGELVALSVRDHGPGIPRQELPRVFERFYKGDASRSAGGVGLGLAIVKHIVRIHSGTVEAESVPGEGATFTVRLPKRFVGARAESPGRIRRAG